MHSPEAAFRPDAEILSMISDSSFFGNLAREADRTGTALNPNAEKT